MISCQLIGKIIFESHFVLSYLRLSLIRKDLFRSQHHYARRILCLSNLIFKCFLLSHQFSSGNLGSIQIIRVQLDYFHFLAIRIKLNSNWKQFWSIKNINYETKCNLQNVHKHEKLLRNVKIEDCSLPSNLVAKKTWRLTKELRRSISSWFMKIFYFLKNHLFFQFKWRL